VLKADPVAAGNCEAADSVVALLPAVRWLDGILQRAAVAARDVYGHEAAADPFRGLHISPYDVQRLLDRPPLEPVLPAGAALDPLLDVAPLACLAREFGLTPLDLAVVLIALAPELDLRYERLYAYLQDDVTRRRPSVDLALNLLCATALEKLARRVHFSAEAPLRRHGIIHVLPESGQLEPPLLAQALKLDDQIVCRLLGQRSLDARLAPYCQHIAPHAAVNDLCVDGERVQALALLAVEARAAERPLRLYFEGPSQQERRRTAAAVAAALGSELLAVDLAKAASASEGFEQALALAVRRAGWLGAVLYLDRFEVLSGDDARAAVFDVLAAHTGVAILAGVIAWGGPPFSPTNAALGVLAVSFGVPDAVRRLACWRTALEAEGESLPLEDLEALAGRFRLTVDQIAAAMADARVHARFRHACDPLSDAPAPLQLDDLYAAARGCSGGALATLSQKIRASYTWDDIVLPADALAQLREICRRVELQPLVMDEWGFAQRLSLGKGVNALFAGSSGTGKTMAAEVLAAHLGLDLYRIDLSSVVSKYIGETEKNLDRIFHAAESANAILFFDEADALFGKRSEVRDSHDRYANIEIAYLLQKMEQYEGVTILATNLRANLDESFTRRLTFTVHFPFPDEASRSAIWRRIWPAGLPLAEDVDLNLLAARFKLAGGNIKNVALAAAFFAAEEGRPVRMRHLLRAVRREYQKLGKTLSDAELLGGFDAAAATGER
jgi:AAA+ superfamily predicted ATPase